MFNESDVVLCHVREAFDELTVIENRGLDVLGSIGDGNPTTKLMNQENDLVAVVKGIHPAHSFMTIPAMIDKLFANEVFHFFSS